VPARPTRALASFLVCFWLFALSSDAHAQTNIKEAFESLGWKQGPTSGDLGNIAAISVPADFRFVGHGPAAKFMELLENPSDGDELGVLLHDDSWFVVFSFAESGYVDDQDRNLDGKQILESIRDGTARANKVRRERGWAPLEILGWQQEPFYDASTNNLTWAIRGNSEGSTSINHSVRLLGRRGVMHVDLVTSAEELSDALPVFQEALNTFSFKPGQRYAEFTRGDRVAEYGLAGLIVGGTGAALVKTGLLQKFWKLIVIGFLAVAGFLKKLFTRDRSEPIEESSRV
jgi:uncharacterized membrane-anchored protein